MYEVLLLSDYQEENTFNRDAIIADEEANFAYPDESAEDLALEAARDSLRFNTVAGDWLRNGGTMHFDGVAVKLDADEKPVLVFPQF